VRVGCPGFGPLDLPCDGTRRCVAGEMELANVRIGEAAEPVFVVADPGDAG